MEGRVVRRVPLDTWLKERRGWCERYVERKFPDFSHADAEDIVSTLVVQYVAAGFDEVIEYDSGLIMPSRPDGTRGDIRTHLTRRAIDYQKALRTREEREPRLFGVDSTPPLESAHRRRRPTSQAADPVHDEVIRSIELLRLTFHLRQEARALDGRKEAIALRYVARVYGRGRLDSAARVRPPVDFRNRTGDPVDREYADLLDEVAIELNPDFARLDGRSEAEYFAAFGKGPRPRARRLMSKWEADIRTALAAHLGRVTPSAADYELERRSPDNDLGD